MNKIKVGDKEIPVLNWEPAPGQVILTYEDQYKKGEDGWELPNAKKGVKTAIVVSHGADDGFDMNKSIKVGARVVMPFVRKQAFEENGNKFFIVHHLDIKLIDPVENFEEMCSLIKFVVDRMPDAVQQELRQYLVAKTVNVASNVK